MVLFTKDIMDTDKPITGVNIKPVRFIGGPTNHGRTGNIKVYWYQQISVAVITTVGVPVDENFSGNLMKSRKLVIHMECDEMHTGWCH